MADERLMRINGVDLGVTTTGSGRPLLLLPGGGCGDYLALVAEQIDGMATVHRMEPRGCGVSTADGNYDIATTLADVDELRRSLGIERWIVGGHSSGAFLALAYAIHYPGRVEAVLHIAGIGLQNDRAWNAAYDAGLEAGLDREVSEEEYKFNPEVNRVEHNDYKEYVRRPRLWRDVADLTVPVRAFHGELDIRPVWPVEQLVALLPDATLEIIPGASHALWSTHRDELGMALRATLTELEPSTDR